MHLNQQFCVPNVFFEESRALICKRKTLESAYFTRVSRVFDNGAGDGNRTRASTLPTHEPLLQTCVHTPKSPINTSIFASIFYLGTKFSKPHVPKCIKLTFSVNLFLSKTL